jgi:hypothetical protein
MDRAVGAESLAIEESVMAKLTVVFGVLLGVLGLGEWIHTGSVHPTALIPVWFGLGLIVCGVLALGDNPKKRMLWMHIAVTIGLLGFIFPAVRSIVALGKAHSTGVALAHPAAVHEELAMAAICLLFVAWCVRSFIAARRSRLA